MFLNSACTKTGKPDATVTEVQPLAKARNKKNLCTLIPDLKKIYVFICISNKCVSLEQDIFFTFYRKLQLSDSWTEPRRVTKVNVTLAASANLFL